MGGKKGKIKRVKSGREQIALLGTLLVLGGFFFLGEILILSHHDLSPYLLVGLFLLLISLYIPMQNTVSRLLTRQLFSKQAPLETFLEKINHNVNTSVNLEALLKNSSWSVMQHLKASRIYGVITDGENTLTIKHGQAGHLTDHDAKWLVSFLQHNRRELILKNEIKNQQAKDVMTTAQVVAFLPFVRNNKVLGFFAIGEKKNKKRINRNDAYALSLVQPELSVALQNASSLENLHQLNANLQQKINNATKQLKASNRQLQKLDVAKNEFISIASHQLRTPLTSVKGYIDMVLSGDAGRVTPLQKKFLSEAFASSERMVTLISDFLSLSRLQTGRFVIEKTPTNIAKVLKEEVVNLERIAERQEKKIKLSIDKNIPTLLLDEAKIRQVMINFIDNALHYSKDKETVVVTLELNGNFLEFTVVDNGIGVPEAAQAKLFGKFFRAENARQRRPDGTGVGLFLAKKVITGHGGEIIFQSKENEGSTFGFKLPLPKDLNI